MKFQPGSFYHLAWSERRNLNYLLPLQRAFPFIYQKVCMFYPLWPLPAGFRHLLDFLFKKSIRTLATRHRDTDGRSNIQRLFDGDAYYFCRQRHLFSVLSQDLKLSSVLQSRIFPFPGHNRALIGLLGLSALLSITPKSS